MLFLPSQCFVQRNLLIAGLSFFLFPLANSQAALPITSDNTLGTSVNKTGSTYDIGGGTAKGSSLFHSFGLFSVPVNETANFLGAGGIVNILSRVTGGQPSQIDGRIQSLSGANLYFMNPSGIIFGRTASLNVNGSFHATTASYMSLFDLINGGSSKFYADPMKDNLADSLLKVPPPASFGFLQPTGFGFTTNSPASITVTQSSLGVPAGQTLSLIGGDIVITGDPNPPPGQSYTGLFAPGGMIQIASVASQGEVILSLPGSPPSLDVSSFSSRGQITLSNNALIDVSGLYACNNGVCAVPPSGVFFCSGGLCATPGGTVLLRGRDLLVDNSSISAQSVFFDGMSPGIDLDFEKTVTIANNSRVSTTALFAEKAGDIRIKSGDLTIDSLASVFSNTDASSLDLAHAGDLTLTVDSLSITGGGSLANNFVFFGGGAGLPGAGLPGAITISATGPVTVSGQLLGQKSNITSFSNQNPTGPLTITAATLLLDQGAQVISGATTISTHNFSMENGAVISTLIPTGSGPAGTVSITTDDSLLISGAGSGIFTGASSASQGRAGNISLDAGTLILADGAGIHSGTLSTGNAGTISITVRDKLSLSGDSVIESLSDGPGRAGDIVISAPVLTMDTGAFITAAAGLSSTGGQAGDIKIDVGQLTMAGNSSIFNNTFGSGHAGKLHVSARQLISLAEDSDLTSNTNGTGRGGQISIDAPLILVNNGLINTTSTGAVLSTPALGGPAGDIFLHVNDLAVTAGGLITAATVTGGQGGSVTVNASN
jgi:filamentous hemagglutinin family protein